MNKGRTVLILGAQGRLGFDLREVFARKPDFRVIAAGRNDVDIAQCDEVMQLMGRVRPRVVINCAAFTDVDRCEKERERAFQVNARGAEHIAIGAQEHQATLVQISTDYVFDGDKGEPYHEDDAPNPLNVYGNSKLQGETLVREACRRHFIVRTGWLYGAHGGNFVKTMLTLAQSGEEVKVIDDQRGTPTWTRCLARQIAALIDAEAYGIYHATCQGACTWREFAEAIFERAGIAVAVVPVSSAAFARPARRPASAVLDNGNLRSLGIDRMPGWEAALDEFLKEFGVGSGV